MCVYVCACVCLCAGEERLYLGKDRCQITMVLQVDPRVRQAAGGSKVLFRLQGFVFRLQDFVFRLQGFVRVQ